MGYFGKFNDALWANAADLVMCCGPLRWIWLWAVGHCGEFGYVLCASAANEALQ
jgi:hypothetical protein